MSRGRSLGLLDAATQAGRGAGESKGSAAAVHEPHRPATRTGHRLAALIPAYDVAGSIRSVVEGASRHCETVLVVDDGSSDATALQARSVGAQVVRHDTNRGKGASIRSGLVRLLAEGFTHAFSLDGDGQHLADEMPLLIEESRADPSAIVLGARRIDAGQQVAPIRRFGNEFANWWVSLAAGREYRDTQTGFRIYPIHATLEMGVRAERFEYESEVLILAARRGIEVRTREVAVYYPPPGERVSHYEPWRDTCRIIFTVVPFLVGLRR